MIANAARLLRNAIVLSSIFSAGVALWGVWDNLVEVLFRRHWKRLFYASALFGYAGVVLLVAELVFHVPTVPVAWRTYLYEACLMFGVVGLLGIGLDQKKQGIDQKKQGIDQKEARG